MDTVLVNDTSVAPDTVGFSVQRFSASRTRAGSPSMV